MKRLNDEAYVLRVQPLAEADLIVSLLAMNHGKVRGVARHARRSRRRFGGTLEPLSRVHATWLEREGRELHRIEAFELRRSYAAMQADRLRQVASAVLAELSETFAHEGHPEERGFRLLGSTLDALEGGRPPVTVVRYFEYWTLRLHGLLPDLKQCGMCGRRLPRGRATRVSARSGAVCAACDGQTEDRSRSLGRAQHEFLMAASELPPGKIDADPGTVAPGGALEALLRGRLEAFAEKRFRAYRHLNGAWSENRAEGGAR